MRILAAEGRGRKNNVTLGTSLNIKITFCNFCCQEGPERPEGEQDIGNRKERTLACRSEA